FTWVKFLRSNDEAPDFIIKFLKMIQVRLKTHVRRIRADNGTEFINQTLRKYYEQVGISHETSVALSPQQNGVVKRRNRTLIEPVRTMLIYAKALLFLWAEAVATACYTQNRSMIRLRHEKTPYELLHKKPPDLSFLHVFGALCYPTNDSENLGKLQPKIDIGLALYKMTPATIYSRLMPNIPPLTLFVPPSRTNWDILLQPLFDELLTPPPSVDHPAPEVIALIAEVVAPEPVASTDLPFSTTVDQDTPSPSNSQTTPKTQSPIIPNDVEDDNHDLDVAHMNNDPFFGIPFPEVHSDQSLIAGFPPSLPKQAKETKSPERSITSATIFVKIGVLQDTPSSFLIIAKEHESPQLVSSSEEPLANKPTTPVSDDNVNELVQEDVAEIDGNTFINPFCIPLVEEAESSLTYQDLSNMHEFYQNIA
nr:integrase, catalytic region, zinc finger, CCHC-type, peptidase aspartic, catalytic [Tanacetum cinerariifolium]